MSERDQDEIEVEEAREAPKPEEEKPDTPSPKKEAREAPKPEEEKPDTPGPKKEDKERD